MEIFWGFRRAAVRLNPQNIDSKGAMQFVRQHNLLVKKTCSQKYRAG